jgi:hypothetical protein
MLHAWDIPAWVDDRPYVDAFYTCACPALELVEIGFECVIAVSTEPKLYRDIMRDQLIPASWLGQPIHIIAPRFDPAEMGVNYTTATEEGLAAVYDHGQRQAEDFFTAFSF